MNLPEYGFHESTVADLRGVNGSVSLELEDVVLDGRNQDARIEFIGVTRIAIDGLPVDRVAKDLPDGEVLTLRQDGNTATLIVEWRDFEQKLSRTRSYEITFRSLAFTAVPVETSALPVGS